MNSVLPRSHLAGARRLSCNRERTGTVAPPANGRLPPVLAHQLASAHQFPETLAIVGGGQPRFPGARKWTAPSNAGAVGFLNSGFLYLCILNASSVSVKRWSRTSRFGLWFPDRPSSATAGVMARKELKVYFNLPDLRSVPVKSWPCTSWFGQLSPDQPRPPYRLSWMGIWLIFAARMKSFSLSPPMAWVQSSTAT
jgi:hypothetical protein